MIKAGGTLCFSSIANVGKDEGNAKRDAAWLEAAYQGFVLPPLADCSHIKLCYSRMSNNPSQRERSAKHYNPS